LPAPKFLGKKEDPMKFFDPKKKEPSTPENPVANPRPAPVQQTVATFPKAQPAPTPPAPLPEAPKPEPVKIEAVKMEQKIEQPKPQLVTMPLPSPEPPRAARTGKTLIGNSVIIRGEITSEENLQIEGVVDGSVESSSDVLVGSEGRVNATIRAVNISIHGRVIGDCIAGNKLEIAPSGLLQGNIRSPKVSIAEKALFRGSIDMRPKEAVTVRESKEKKEQVAPLETVEK
jgi:cytoskeletal protein CcmA (bactofilin family)